MVSRSSGLFILKLGKNLFRDSAADDLRYGLDSCGKNRIRGSYGVIEEPACPDPPDTP